MEHVGLDWRNIPAIGCHLSNNLKQFQLSFKIESLWKTFKCLSNVFNYFQHWKTLKDFDRLSKIFQIISIIFHTSYTLKVLEKVYQGLSNHFNVYHIENTLTQLEILSRSFEVFWISKELKVFWKSLIYFQCISVYFQRNFAFESQLKDHERPRFETLFERPYIRLKELTLSILFQCSTGTLQCLK